MEQTSTARQPTVGVDFVAELNRLDLDHLCDATDAAIVDGNGFGWLKPQPRDQMERYWKGVLLVPERQFWVGRLDGTIAASAQIQLPPRFNEAQAHSPQLTTHFVAPWARGHGLAAMLLEAVEAHCRDHGYTHLRLDVRETQTRAIEVYEAAGFTRWGVLPSYAKVEGKPVTGFFYVKTL
ncbi:MAG: GNAT family N-acetyltransferase [Alphaproteobacteria bacterium]|nr:GNAT family N-acetyltransferase [Rhodospirillaceae bacterium]MBT7647959.1 GNAT family N-acetyltransferase [Rhodospirillaceae bacterium]MDG2479518.1 GNAT family N-acetyltransferase [Alphaproteobacteria bacterium]